MIVLDNCFLFYLVIKLYGFIIAYLTRNISISVCSIFYKMDGINILLSIVFLLIITFIGLVRAESIGGVFACFVLLTVISYVTIYLFKA